MPSILVDALARQLAERDPTAPVTRHETHISWVLLAGDAACKIKKPVRLPFLDFSTLAQRRQACADELRLNRRLAPMLYLDVVDIGGTPEQPVIGGTPAIEVMLRMRRFPDGALFSERLRSGTLQAAHVDDLAAQLAAFHRAAAPAGADGPYGSAATVAATLRATVASLATSGAEVADLRAWLQAQCAALAPTWQQRLHDGCVCEGHGDLHLANAVVLADGRAVAFDCIEFDPALRWIDRLDDTSFMVMDLLAHGRDDLAWRFLATWLDHTGDHAGIAVLRPYLVHRALVRALVGRLSGPPKAAGDGPPRPDYLALARRLVVPGRPWLAITHGLSGSGKSVLTQSLLEGTGALRLRSDVERKRLHGLPALARSAAVPGGIYGSTTNTATYARLHDVAAAVLQAGWPVILDAAFLRRTERLQMRDLAARLQVPFSVLDCQAPLEVLTARVTARRLRGGDPSEADEAVLQRQLGHDEPASGSEVAHRLTVRTDRPIDIAALARCAAQAAVPGTT
jgi:aminoglycoside phosphotransferase family enzyme/predicted kinase